MNETIVSAMVAAIVVLGGKFMEYLAQRGADSKLEATSERKQQQIRIDSLENKISVLESKLEQKDKEYNMLYKDYANTLARLEHAEYRISIIEKYNISDHK